MVRVKICGITDPADGQAAAACGVDIVGLNLYKGPRCITLAQARAIAQALPPFTSKVVLLGKQDLGRLDEICVACDADGVQLHGLNRRDDEVLWAQVADALEDRVLIRPVRVRGPEDMASLGSFQADVYLLDAYVEGQEGGTGKTFDWSLAAQAKEHGLVMLAGGLTPANVAEAVRQVRPFAVDCSSGVEAAPGKKDHGLMAAFVANAKAARLDPL